MTYRLFRVYGADGDVSVMVSVPKTICYFVFYCSPECLGIVICNTAMALVLWSDNFGISIALVFFFGV
jgi:hypothetical protein